jgi:hypothetical protein
MAFTPSNGSEVSLGGFFDFEGMVGYDGAVSISAFNQMKSGVEQALS